MLLTERSTLRPADTQRRTEQAVCIPVNADRITPAEWDSAESQKPAAGFDGRVWTMDEVLTWTPPVGITSPQNMTTRMSFEDRLWKHKQLQHILSVTVRE